MIFVIVQGSYHEDLIYIIDVAKAEKYRTLQTLMSILDFINLEK